MAAEAFPLALQQALQGGSQGRPSQLARQRLGKERSGLSIALFEPCTPLFLLGQIK